MHAGLLHFKFLNTIHWDCTGDLYLFQMELSKTELVLLNLHHLPSLAEHFYLWKYIGQTTIIFTNEHSLQWAPKTKKGDSWKLPRPQAITGDCHWWWMVWELSSSSSANGWWTIWTQVSVFQNNLMRILTWGKTCFQAIFSSTVSRR